MKTYQLGILSINQLSYEQYKKAEDERKLKENELYLVRDVDPMIVTISNISEGKGTASHASSDIYSHLEKGGHAVISQEYDGKTKYIPIVSCSQEEAAALDVSSTASVMIHKIDVNKNYELISHGIGNVEEAIGKIESLHTQLVAGTLGIFTFEINGEIFTAPANSTWGEWCNSEHNTIDAVSSENTQSGKLLMEVTGGYIATDTDPAQPVQSGESIQVNGKYKYISSLPTTEE